MKSVRSTILGAMVVAAASVLTSAHAGAQQVIESAGERALGMGGAFVAVADDATAVHWNPAGLASGRPAGMTIGWHRFQIGDQSAPPVEGTSRRTGTLTSLGTWPVGLSYGRFRSARFVVQGDGEVRAETLRNSTYALTLLHTISDGLVVGTTLKYVRGGIVSTPADGPTAADAFGALDEQEVDSRGAFDLDVGLMANFHYVRLGVMWRNLRSPSFGDVATPATTLPRQTRVGVAVLPTDGLTLAMDVDLDAVALPDGPRRMFALGGESRLGARLAVRSGVRWNLTGLRRPVAAVGGSVMVRSGLWLDGHYAYGRLQQDREFGAALRAGY